MNLLKIVFVEINRLPRYTIENISRLRQIFPKVDVVLLTDWATYYANPEITDLCQVVPISAELDQKLINLSRYQNSNDPFWVYTTQRLFALCDFHAKNPTFSILHVESDVLLMPNFPFDRLLNIDTLLWGNYNLTHDVASLVYLPTIDMTNMLLKAMHEHLDTDTNHSDMTLLRTVAMSLGNNHAYFPSLPNKNSVMINSHRSWPKDFIAKQFQLFEQLRGIFDHQIIGMYLDGLDPHLTYGMRETLFDKTVSTGESFIDPRKVKFLLNKELSLNEDQLTYPIYSIHLHSKQLELFRDKSELFVKRISDANEKTKHVTFDVKVFYELVVSNARRGKLSHWSRHLVKFFFARFLTNRS